jgi:hypothetical protein
VVNIPCDACGAVSGEACRPGCVGEAVYRERTQTTDAPNPYDAVPREDRTPLALPTEVLQAVEDALCSTNSRANWSPELEFAIALLKGFDSAAELRSYLDEL